MYKTHPSVKRWNLSSLGLTRSRRPCLLGLPLQMSCALRQQPLFPLLQHLKLAILHSLNVVSEYDADADPDWISHCGAAVEERAHFYAELPHTGEDTLIEWLVICAEYVVVGKLGIGGGRVARCGEMSTTWEGESTESCPSEQHHFVVELWGVGEVGDRSMSRAGKRMARIVVSSELELVWRPTGWLLSLDGSGDG